MFLECSVLFRHTELEEQQLTDVGENGSEWQVVWFVCLGNFCCFVSVHQTVSEWDYNQRDLATG